jgi:hypothetical protein
MAMGGIGEAMLMGAAMGGGTAALTGGDPLKGALLGGLSGGIGGGISGALGAAGTTAGTLTGTGLTAGTAGSTLGTAGGTAASTLGTTLGGNLGNSLAALDPLAATTAANSGITTLANGLPAGTTNQIVSAAPAENFAWNSATRMNDIIPNTTPATIAPAAAPSGVANTSVLKADVGNFASPNYSLGKPVDLPNANYSLAKSATPVAPAAPAGPQTFTEGMQKFMKDPIASIKADPMTAASSALAGASAKKKREEPEEYDGPLKRFKFNPESYRSAFYGAEGGIADLGGYDRMVGEQPMYQAMASGGISNLGSYSDGGRMLKGPGDGMSDSIPANISGKRPARLADGEFVVPADVVSHLGNGSTDAGAKQLYAMMSKIRQARTGRKAQGREINPRQYVPA